MLTEPKHKRTDEPDRRGPPGAAGGADVVAHGPAPAPLSLLWRNACAVLLTR